MIQRTINNLAQLGDGDGGDVAVFCFTLYFMSMCLCAVNAKEVPWEKKITIGPHCSGSPDFTGVRKQ